MLLAVPGLFVAGILFGYFVVLPAAIRFFENFNASEFNVLVQASQYYHFAAMTVLAMGLLFQIPVAIIAATRAQIVTARQLRHNRRYAILACVAIAALLPGDITTMAPRDRPALRPLRSKPAPRHHRRTPQSASRARRGLSAARAGRFSRGSRGHAERRARARIS